MARLISDWVHGVRAYNGAFFLALVVGGCAAGRDGGEPTGNTELALGMPSATEYPPITRWNGRMQAVAVDQADLNFVLAASDSGGVFRSTNGGATWSHLDTLRATHMSDIKICPTNREIVVATSNQRTGLTFASDTGGIWVSTNHGDTWQRVTVAGTPAGPYGAHGIAFRPGTNCQEIVVAYDRGVARSVNGGGAWTHTQIGGVDLGVWSIAIQSDGTIDVHGWYGHRRRDAMGNWSPERRRVGAITGSDPNGLMPAFNTHSLAVSPLNQNVLYGVSLQSVEAKDKDGDGTNETYDPTGPWEGFESDDGGTTWHSMVIRPPAYGNGRPPFVHAVISRDTARTDETEVYVGDSVNVIRQKCREAGGAGARCTIGTGVKGDPTWELLDLDPRNDGSNCFADPDPTAPCSHTDPSELAFDPTTHCPVYLGNDGGMLKATLDNYNAAKDPDVSAANWATLCGATGSWRNVGKGTLNALQISEMTGQVHPNLPAHSADLFIAMQDNGHWTSMDDGQTWPGSALWEGGAVQLPHSEPDRTNTKVVYTTCAGCGTYISSPGFTSTQPWKHSALHSCPDEDKNGACDPCVDLVDQDGNPTPDLVCDKGAVGGVLCRDENGLPRLANDPVSTACIGITCVDKVQWDGGEGTDGLCDPIGSGLQARTPIVISPGKYVEWSGGALKYSDNKILQPNQLYLTTNYGANWSAVPNATFGVAGQDPGQYETPAGPGSIALETGGTAVFYQGTLIPPAAGGWKYGLIRVSAPDTATPTFARADAGINNLNIHQVAFNSPLVMASVDRLDARRLLASDSNGMRRSSDRGATWSQPVSDAGMAQLYKLVSANGRLDYDVYDNSQVSAIAFDSVDPQRIVVGTEQAGLVSSLNGGNTWARLCRTDEIPTISSIFFNELDDEVFVSSYGRGVWKVDPAEQQVPSFTTAPAPVTANNCGAVNIGTATATDLCETPPATVTVVAGQGVTSSNPAYGCDTGARPCGNFPRGPTTVTWTATDTYGDVTTTTSVVTVNDTTPPVITPVSDITLVACNTAGESVTLTKPTAIDTCVGSVTVTGQVTASDTATVPITISPTGQVTLPAGNHTITWSASDGITTSTSIQHVTVRPGIFTNRQVQIRDRAKTILTSGAGAAIANRGTLQTQIGLGSLSGGLLSVAPVSILDRGQVQGSIRSQGAVTRGSQTVVTGTIQQNVPVTLPTFPTLAGIVTPPATGPSDPNVNPGPAVLLPPGSYKNYWVNSGGTLQLSTGDYFFTGLTQNSASSIIKIDDTAGPVRIFVSNIFAYRSQYIRPNGTPAEVLLGYRGTTTITLEAQFLGTLFAPSATVEIGTATAQQVRGRFNVQSLILRPDTTLVCLSNLAPVTL